MRSLLALAVLLTAHLALAKTYFVRPTAGGSVAADQLTAVHELVMDTLMNLEDVDLVDDEKKAEFVLEPKVLKLENSYVVTVSKLSKGKVVTRQKARATNFDDVDTVTKRATRAAVLGVRAEADVRINDVTADEVTRGKKRIETVNQHFFGIGPGAGVNLNAKGLLGVNFTIGHTWGLNEHTGLTLFLQGMPIRGNDSFFVNGGLGLEHHFNDRNHAPFALASVGYGVAGIDAEGLAPGAKRSNDGFTVGVGAGWKFFRASVVNMGISVQYVQMTTSNELGLPGMVTGNITIYVPGSPQNIPVLGGMF